MRRAGFTLVELMIVLGLIGALAAIAIPGFLRYQMRSKAAEAGVNLAAIRVAEEVYFAEQGVYASVAAPVPATVPGSSRTPWPGSADFDQLGWQPEGSVYFQYLVTVGSAGGGPDHYTAEAASDLDSDGAKRFWGVVRPAPGTSTGVAGALTDSTCQATGIYDPDSGAQTLLDTVGPCDAGSARGVF